MSDSNMYTMTKVMTDLFVDSAFPDTGNTFRGMLTQSDFWRVSHMNKVIYQTLYCTFLSGSSSLLSNRGLPLWNSFLCLIGLFVDGSVILQFAEGPMLDGLYWEQYYNNDNVSAENLGYVYYENKLMGVPRLRQLRVRNDSCTVCWFLLG